MPLKFNRDERGFVTDLNNLANANVRSVRTDCEVIAHAPADMGVRVGSGTVFFGQNVVTVAQQDLAISASHASLDRIDIILVDDAGTASVVTGTPAALPQTPNYDPTTTVCLARVFVDDLSTTVPSGKITDLRVINEGVGTFGKFVQPFTSQTTVTVVHGLLDAEPMVMVYDNTNKAVIPESITIDSDTQVTITLNPAASGKVIVQGGAGIIGGGGGVTTYIHNQPAPALTWNVNHNLGQQVVSVQCYDGSDIWVQPNSITLTDANNLTITFLSSTDGKAIIKK